MMAAALKYEFLQIFCNLQKEFHDSFYNINVFFKFYVFGVILVIFLYYCVFIYVV